MKPEDKPLYIGFEFRKYGTKGAEAPLPSNAILSNDRDSFAEVEGDKPADTKPEASAAETISKGSLAFEAVESAFFEQMLAFLDVMPMSSIAVSLGKSMIVERLRRHALEASLQPPERSGSWEVISLPPESRDIMSRKLQQARRQSESMWVVPNIFLMGLVSQYDSYFGTLIRILSDVKPHIVVGSKRQFTASEVFFYSNIESFKSAVVEKEVESVLRESHEEQFAWLESKLDIKLRSGLESWPLFVEICERRNLFAHANGVVSEQYILKCKSAGHETTAKPGERLRATPKYLNAATSIILEIGVKLTQVLWRATAPEDDRHERADGTLNEMAFALIYHGHYDTAIKLLQFAFLPSFKHPNSIVKHMMIVNLANAYKLAGKIEKSNETLDAIDWRVFGKHFQTCVAAIKNDKEKLFKLIGEVPTDDISPQNYFGWPVFRPFRDDPDFIRTLSLRFGEELIGSIIRILQSSSSAAEIEEA